MNHHSALLLFFSAWHGGEYGGMTVTYEWEMMVETFEVLEQFEMPELLRQLEYLLRVFVATCLGVLIGHERKSRNKSAGIRTHAIVAFGAALIMVVSKYGFTDIPHYDAARVAAQVVSGVGFIGAGVIFIRNNLVNGLTTAAGMWATAGIGLAMGAGMYVVAIASTLMISGIQALMHKITFFANVALGGDIRMTIAQKPEAVKNMREFLEKQRIEIISVKIVKNKKSEIKLEFDVVYPPGFKKATFLARLVELEDVYEVSE